MMYFEKVDPGLVSHVIIEFRRHGMLIFISPKELVIDSPFKDVGLG
jgi:hypothetical protein